MKCPPARTFRHGERVFIYAPYHSHSEAVAIDEDVVWGVVFGNEAFTETGFVPVTINGCMPICCWWMNVFHTKVGAIFCMLMDKTIPPLPEVHP